jgi:superfamily II DNA/RNA helicase
MKKWNVDEDLEIQISADIKKGIIEGLNFSRPSHIQSVAIPLILGTDEQGYHQNLIAQSKNGSGKTGAFAIGSVMRVDPAL